MSRIDVNLAATGKAVTVNFARGQWSHAPTLRYQHRSPNEK
jgi:hypothetical protein